jgi:hypothetical protein
VSDREREDYLKLLYDAHHDASRDYDQAILTLSAGTLALSVTFVHDITPSPAAGSRHVGLAALNSPTPTIPIITAFPVRRGPWIPR